MNNKGFANIVLIVLVVVLAGVAGYFALTREQKPTAQQTTPSPLTTPTPISQQPSPTPTNEMASWKTYRNTFSRIELKYPQSWKLTETEEFKDKVSMGMSLFSLESATGDCRIILSEAGGGGNLGADLTYEDKKERIDGRDFDTRTFYYRTSKDQIKWISIYNIPNPNYELQLRSAQLAQFPYDIIQPDCINNFYKILATAQFI